MVDQSIPRRKFTKLVGATAAVGAAAGCMHNEGEGPAEPGDEPGEGDDLDEDDGGLGEDDNESEDDGLGDEDNESEEDN